MATKRSRIVKLGQGTTAHLPALPPLSPARETRPHHVPADKQGRIPGRWYRMRDKGTVATGAWQGRCGKCGRMRPAVQLVHKIRPFGRGEYWGCREGC